MAFTMWVKSEVVRAILSATKQERKSERHEEYGTKQAAGGQKIETLEGNYALKWDDETHMSVNAHVATEPGGSRPVPVVPNVPIRGFATLVVGGGCGATALSGETITEINAYRII